MLGDATTRDGAGVGDGAAAPGLEPVSGFGDVQDVNATIIMKPTGRALTRTGYVRETHPWNVTLPRRLGSRPGARSSDMRSGRWSDLPGPASGGECPQLRSFAPSRNI